MSDAKPRGEIVIPPQPVWIDKRPARAAPAFENNQRKSDEADGKSRSGEGALNA